MVEQAKVNTPCSAYRTMSSSWGLIDHLLGGSGPMRANSSTYLPRFDKEQIKHYTARVNRSIVYSAYADTAKNIVSKPFSRKMTFQGELPPPLDQIADDVDGQGKTIMQLSREVFTHFVNRGLGHILVDYPVTVDEQGGTPNLKQERDAGYRPRFIAIAPDQLIGWRTEQDAIGKPVLTQIRISETRTEPDGEWGDQPVEYVRVIEPAAWRLYRCVKEEYVVVQEGVNSLGQIPLVTGYANQTGFLMADPPLRELAETNLAHYQSDSDQRNILHMARTVTLFLRGFTQDEADHVALGPNQIIATTNENADAKFIEHAGHAIEAGRKDIEELEMRMVQLGLQPFTQKVGNQTATGQGIDESRANCDIQAWVMALEDLMYNAYALAAEWIGVEMPDDFKPDVFNDFAIWMRAAQDVDQLIKMRQAGEVSRRTFLREVKRRNVLSETVDVEEEVTQIESEGPALAMVGVNDEGEE